MLSGLFSARRDLRDLGSQTFAARSGGGTIPKGAFAYQLQDGERGRVELSGRFKAARGEIFYLVHRGPYTLRFAPDPAAPEYGIEAEVAVPDQGDAPEALAALFAEQVDEDRWPDAIRREDLAAAAAVALGDDLLEPCMNAEEWAHLKDTFAYRLRRRFGLTLLACHAVTLGEADGVDAAGAALAAIEPVPEASVPERETTAADAHPGAVSDIDTGVRTGQPDTVSEAAFVASVARSFRMPKSAWRGPAFRPEALDARLQARLRAQLPPLGTRIDRLGHELGGELAPHDRLRLRDLQLVLSRSHAGMGYIGELGADGVGPGGSRHTRRRRLAALRDASDSFEAISRVVADLELANTALDPSAIAALESAVETLSLSLARRAFGWEETA